MAAEKSPLQVILDDLESLGITGEEAEAVALTMYIPTVNARVDRKINMGNYESLGIGLSVNVPLVIPERLKPVFERIESEGLRQAYNQAATEINKRVDRIKARAKAED